MSRHRFIASKLSNAASRARHWFFPIFIVGAAAGLALLSLSFLVLNFATDYRSLTVKKPFVVIDAPYAPPYEAVPSTEVEPTIPHATVTFQIQKHLVQDNKVSVAVQLRVPDEVKKQFWAGFLDGRPLSRDEILKSFADAVMNIDIIDQYQTSTSIRIPVPLKEIFAMERNGIMNYVYTTSAEFPVFGQQSSYPNDWYLYGGLVSLSLPKGVVLYDGKGGFMPQIPVQTKIGLGVGMAGRQLVVMQKHGSDDPYYVETEFELVRSGGVQLYTYAMACIPLAFVMILLHSYFVRAGTGESASSSVVEALAVTLAVLPLRLVLVPAEILELTRVDLILGLAITFTLSLMAIKYVHEILLRKRGGLSEHTEGLS